MLTLEGGRIGGIISFIIRSTEGGDPGYYQDWPAQPFDPGEVGAFFERFGLPARLD